MPKKTKKKPLDYYENITKYNSLIELKDMSSTFLCNIKKETMNKLKSILLEHSLWNDDVKKILNDYHSIW